MTMTETTILMRIADSLYVRYEAQMPYSVCFDTARSVSDFLGDMGLTLAFSEWTTDPLTQYAADPHQTMADFLDRMMRRRWSE